MATNVIAFPVNLRKNKNQYNPGYGNYYAEADTKEECTFKGAYVIESKKKTIDGKQVTYQEKIPLSSWAVATHTDPEP